MRKYDLLAGILIALAAILLLYQIDKPFWGQFDWTGAWFGTIARNYLQIDLPTTRLAPITVSGTTLKSDWTFYNHYTITYPLMVTASLALFGVHEWSIRLVSLVFSLLMLGAFYVLCRRFFHSLVGIFGIFTVIFTPMFIYYGKLPVHEQPVLFFSLVSLYFYLAWLKSWARSDFRKMLIFITLGFLTSWTGAFVLILITFHLVLNHRYKVFRLFPAYLLVLLIAILHLAHILVSSDLKDFSQTLADRTSGGVSQGKQLFTPLTFVLKQIKWFFALYTRPLALITIISSSLLVFRAFNRRQLTPELQLCLLFLCWGFFEWLLVSRIAWIHDYMLIYFLPFVAFSSGFLFWRIYSRIKTFGLLLITATIIFAAYLSLPFTTALLFSKDQTGNLYPVATYIKTNSVYGDRILVAVKPESDFEIHYPVHYLSFYSDRYIKYQFTDSSNWKGDYKFIITPDDFADKNLTTILNSNFQVKKIAGFSVYETR